ASPSKAPLAVPSSGHASRCQARAWHRGGASVQPGREEGLDVAAPARAREASLHLPPLDDDERRHLVDLEPLHEVGSFLARHAVELERAVVSPALEDLRQEALDAAAVAREGRVEENEARFDDSLG